MTALVGYASSDDEDEIQPAKPAKIAKLESKELSETIATEDDERSIANPTEDARPTSAHHAPAANTSQPTEGSTGPAPGPTMAPTDSAAVDPALSPSRAPLSPYSFERQRLRELTMPTVPNFTMPDPPPPPGDNSEEAAAVAARTKKIEHFLELKKKGVHFNERMQNSSSLRNPSLLPKLMDFAGVSLEDSYRSTLPEELAVPVRWPEDCYVEGLMKQNERSEKKRLAQREKVDFVPAAVKSSGSSAATTPSAGTQHRKTKFDKR